MTTFDLNDDEAELITSLRSEDRDTATEAMRRLIWERLAPMFDPDEKSVNNPMYNNPNSPQLRTYGKVRLWLLAHGIEFEDGVPEVRPSHPNQGNIYRTFTIVINHRYFSLDLMVLPSRGVYKDELNTPHKEIAAYEQKQGGQQ